jgi:hypothetical protein
MIDARDTMGEKLTALARNFGLHKVAAERIGKDSFDVRSSLEDLGSKIFLKNAEYKNILDGLECLANLVKGA